MRQLGRRSCTTSASRDSRSTGSRSDSASPRATSYELLAYLIGAEAHRARRDELVAALFPGRAEATARAYLRQAIHQARHALPETAGLVVTSDWVQLAEPVGISSDSHLFESRLAEAARRQDRERLTATVDALSLLDRGPYLEGVESDWATSRREQLAGVAAEARYEAAELSFALGELLSARRLVDAALRCDSFREATWRIRMRIADALGDSDGVLLAYRDCERALAELGTAPSSTTRRLLERLRR
ncbi:BTAD domain-containing putative transcriptional regulator [Amycolatopsis echigonensis]